MQQTQPNPQQTHYKLTANSTFHIFRLLQFALLSGTDISDLLINSHFVIVPTEQGGGIEIADASLEQLQKEIDLMRDLIEAKTAES